VRLFEILGPDYTVMKSSAGEYKVMKFNGHKEPVGQYKVEKRANSFWTDSPGFIHRGQDEKHIKLVKQFIKDGEPKMTAYKIDSNEDKITSKKFG
jgi:hypothetical protein